MNEFFNSGRAEWVTEKALRPVCQIMEVLHKPRDAQAQTERLRQTNTQKQTINRVSFSINCGAVPVEGITRVIIWFYQLSY